MFVFDFVELICSFKLFHTVLKTSDVVNTRWNGCLVPLTHLRSNRVLRCGRRGRGGRLLGVRHRPGTQRHIRVDVHGARDHVHKMVPRRGESAPGADPWTLLRRPARALHGVDASLPLRDERQLLQQPQELCLRESAVFRLNEVYEVARLDKSVVAYGLAHPLLSRKKFTSRIRRLQPSALE